VVKAPLDAELSKNECQAAQARRRVLARNLYVDYLKTIPYNQWISYPPPEYVCDLDIVQKAIESPVCPPDKDYALFSDIVLELPRIIAEWAQDRRLHLESLVEGFYTSQNNNDGVVIIPGISSVAFSCIKDSCFACVQSSSGKPTHTVFIGLEHALQHHCSSSNYFMAILKDTTFRMRVHSSATSAVSALFRTIRGALRLEFSKTTPHHLDAVDPRVVCLNCNASFYGRRAYSWRSAVSTKLVRDLCCPHVASGRTSLQFSPQEYRTKMAGSDCRRSHRRKGTGGCAYD
jgi:hypothetical protein